MAAVVSELLKELGVLRGCCDCQGVIKPETDASGNPVTVQRVGIH